MTVNLVEQAENVLAGTFLGRLIYGAEYIDRKFWVGGDDDAERADNYRGYVNSKDGWQLLDRSDLPSFNDRNGDSGFTPGGLFNSRAFTPTSNSFDAQGLLAVKDGNTLVMSFRGTDGEDPAVLSGQAFTGQGVAAHYKAFKPLINAAYQYLKDHPEITDVVVSGHSLGGAMADVFALVDADRFRDLRPDGLTIVSLASSGVPKDLPVYLGGIDKDVAELVDKVIIDEFGVEITVKNIKSLNLPSDYISISASNDRAHFPDKFPDIPEDAGLVPIATLKDNLQFGADTIFHLPNIANTDVKYYDIDDHPFDFRGMGAEHSSALLWTNLRELVGDGLFQSYDGQKLIAGVTDYETAPDIDGKPIKLFMGYYYLGDRSMLDDRGERTLSGSEREDYILGMDGDDRIDGGASDDLLSGGNGRDVIHGGGGADKISGGKSRDLMNGDAGQDQFHYGNADESRAGPLSDIIKGFDLDRDLIDVSDIDALGWRSGDQAFQFIGTAAFSKLGQIRAVQDGSDTILQVNITGQVGAEMEIVLKRTLATDVTDTDFNL